MAIFANCPKCRKSVKLADTAAGKRVKCPGCQVPFVVPEAEEDEEVEEVEEAIQPERPVKRPRRDQEENDDRSRPVRRRRDHDEDDEDDDDGDRRERRPSRSIRRRKEIPVPMTPMVYAIGACIFWCAPVVGLALGHLAKTKADAAMDELPSGRRSDSAYARLERAKLIANIGIVLSIIWFVVGGALIIFKR